MEIQTPYLDAIQAVPGDTPGEKFAWMGKLIKKRISECNSLEEVVESDKIPRLLAPLLQVEAVLMLSKKNGVNQSNHGAITEALKSEDMMIVNRALQISSFFDGSNKTITNVQYFFNHLFPYVSLNTRLRIIKELSIHLSPKEPSLAEEFFNTTATTYGLEQAVPLLQACSETFMYNTIVERKIVLSRRFIKTIFRKNPDFVVRYFRLSKPSNDCVSSKLPPVRIINYTDFLVALIKKRLDAFVELYEMHEEDPPCLTLSKKCAEVLLKNGKEYFTRKPKLYIKLIPLKMISESRMEEIYWKLFPENTKHFNTNGMLDYLAEYPQEKKLDLFLSSYRKVYGKNILDDPKNVTVNLMILLPTAERVRQARIKLQKEDDVRFETHYTYTWRCYLTVSEAIPQIKAEIARTSEMGKRAALVCQMIYCCQINNDDQALLEVMTYVRDRHKNEQSFFLLKVLDCLLILYNLPQASHDLWDILLEIFMRAYVKNELPPSNSINVKFLEAALHYKLIHAKPIDQLINLLVTIKSRTYSGYWNILINYPEYERKCLDACLTVVSQKYKSDVTPWKEDSVGVLNDLLSSIYYFNEMHVKNNSRIERMSVKNYPWLLMEMEQIVSADDRQYVYIIQNICRTLKKHEPDLFERFGKKTQDVVKIEDALVVLKKNPNIVLAKWEEYLHDCARYYYMKSSRRFLKALRWYKDIPIRFVKQSFKELTEKANENYFIILACLVHGQTLVKIIEPFLFSEKTINFHRQEAKSDYVMISNVTGSMKIANPPVPLNLISRLCEGDNLSLALSVMTNVCRRTPLMKVIPFAKTLASQRVSVRKHGIRLLHLVAPRDQLYDFLLAQWKTEQNYSIQEVLINKISELFKKEPGPATWSLFSQMISTFTMKNESVFNKLIRMTYNVPDEYVVDFIKLLLQTIDNFAEAGLRQNTINSFTSSLLDKIQDRIYILLPEDFIEELLRKFLFHLEIPISQSAVTFLIRGVLLPAGDKLDSRMNIFSNIFTEVVKNSWNVPHPSNAHFYPVNAAVCRLIDELVNSVVKNDVYQRLIDGILRTFLTVITPEMETMSYLSLVYTKEYLISKTPREFGIKLGQKIGELVTTFTPLIFMFIFKSLESLLSLNTFEYSDETNANLCIIEGLLEVESIEATLTAVNLLKSCKAKEYMDRYDQLMKKIAGYDHPVIKSALCNIKNCAEYSDVSNT